MPITLFGGSRNCQWRIAMAGALAAAHAAHQRASTVAAARHCDSRWKALAQLHARW
jgi:hypothetical protein